MKLQRVSVEQHPLAYPATMADAPQFLRHLTSLSIPESMLMFTPAGTLSARPLIERSVPGYAAVRLTEAALSQEALFMLRLTSAELLLPVRFLAQELGFTAQAPLTWSAYFSKARCPGVLPPHEDLHDVHVFQVFGERVWEVAGTRHHLKAGDLLRIPSGTRHHVVETPADSLHVTLGVHFPNAHGVLRDFLDSRQARLWLTQSVEQPAELLAVLEQALKDYFSKK